MGILEDAFGRKSKKRKQITWAPPEKVPVPPPYTPIHDKPNPYRKPVSGFKGGTRWVKSQPPGWEKESEDMREEAMVKSAEEKLNPYAGKTFSQLQKEMEEANMMRSFIPFDPLAIGMKEAGPDISWLSPHTTEKEPIAWPPLSTVQAPSPSILDRVFSFLNSFEPDFDSSYSNFKGGSFKKRASREKKEVALKLDGVKENLDNTVSDTRGLLTRVFGTFDDWKPEKRIRPRREDYINRKEY